jgi:acyl-coenzyme A thioesterase PaaI-like protein
MNPKLLQHGMNLWPPFIGAGIRVEHIGKDYKTATVKLKLGFANRNIVGVHFGGSLFAMTDPFFMILVQHQLGKDYVVWDRSAKIDFLKPGKGIVRAKFEITDTQIEEILRAASQGEKVLRDFSVDINDASGDVVARVVKTLYIRKKLTHTQRQQGV